MTIGKLERRAALFLKASTVVDFLSFINLSENKMIFLFDLIPTMTHKYNQEDYYAYKLQICGL